METPEARSVSESTLDAMVQSVLPGWAVQEAAPAERGFCSVYRVGAASEGETRTLYVKLSPDGQTWSIPSEVRIQSVLAANTSMPVPEVLGAVDDHETHPTPYYVMEALPGEDVAYERVARFEDDVLRRLAREVGKHLGELHSVPAVDQFGHVRHDGPELRGDAPGGDPETLTVGDPREDWPGYLRERVDAELDRHADSQFADLTDELSAWFEDGISALSGEFDPVLGRNDHGLHNLLVDPETGEVTALLDWGYTLAVPAAFDFEFAIYLYSGAFLAGLPAVSDRRSLVREAMLAGYRDTAPAGVVGRSPAGRRENLVDDISDREPLYEALAMVRIMNDFEHLTVPDDHESAVKARIRRDVRMLLD